MEVEINTDVHRGFLVKRPRVIATVRFTEAEIKAIKAGGMMNDPLVVYDLGNGVELPIFIRDFVKRGTVSWKVFSTIEAEKNAEQLELALQGLAELIKRASDGTHRKFTL